MKKKICINPVIQRHPYLQVWKLGHVVSNSTAKCVNQSCFFVCNFLRILKPRLGSAIDRLRRYHRMIWCVGHYPAACIWDRQGQPPAKPPRNLHKILAVAARAALRDREGAIRGPTPVCADTDSAVESIVLPAGTLETDHKWLKTLFIFTFIDHQVTMLAFHFSPRYKWYCYWWNKYR